MSKDQPSKPNRRSDHNQSINAKGNVHATGGNHQENQQHATSGNNLQQSGRDHIIQNRINVEFLTFKNNGKINVKFLFCNKLVATVLLTIALTLIPYQNSSLEDKNLQEKKDTPLNEHTSVGFWLSYSNNNQFFQPSQLNQQSWKNDSLSNEGQEQLNIDLFDPFSSLQAFDNELKQLERGKEGSYQISPGLFPSRHQGKSYELFATPDSIFMEIPKYGYFPSVPSISGRNNDASSPQLDSPNVISEGLKTSASYPGQVADVEGETPINSSIMGTETGRSYTSNNSETTDTFTEPLNSQENGSKEAENYPLKVGKSIQKNKEKLLDLITTPEEIYPSDGAEEENSTGLNDSKKVPEPQTILGLILSALLLSNLVKKK